MTRKIDAEFENPVDNILINLCEYISPLLKKYNFTPNMLTTIGLFFGLLSLRLLYKNYYVLAVIFFWISYFFDCLDGHFARKYNMCTEFGDYYDHIRDLVVTSGVMILIFSKLKSSCDKLSYLVVLVFFMVLLGSHIGCQQLKSNFKSNDQCLDIFKNMCKHESLIGYTRFFGCATFILVLSTFILAL